MEAGKATGLPASRVMTEAALPSSEYTHFLYTECWLKGQATLPQLLEALRLAQPTGLGPLLDNHTQADLSNQLAITRELVEQGLPFARQFGNHRIAHDRHRDSALSWLTYLVRQINHSRPEDLDAFFVEMTATLQHRLLLRAGSSLFRLTELEIYYHSPSQEHPDPYVHQGEEQLQPLHWYFNQASSLDLTFGDSQAGSYGGILLRGAQRLTPDGLPTGTYISGPILLTRALVASWGSALGGDTSLVLEANPQPVPAPSQPWRSARVGLRLHPEKTEHPGAPYIDRPYRFIANEGYLTQLKNKEKLCFEFELDEATTHRVLGYKPKGKVA
ncbi:hypothetical protein BEN48_09475 [Hymenobacter glacialis]|uniref:Uncharacterized protein n=1 Tax=Hymenobacter glacialis TaxID=1908236 RepID=A0A1G1TCK5_9BACT|nr:hypothetical protein BEN48_09475 [Hymenobacter glacialis]